jgi:hypothetical protein
MKKYIKENPDKFPYIYNESEDAIYSKDGKYMSSLDTFLEIYRKHTGQSFECIYNCPASLEYVLRCTECGTVIFASDDYLYYDNNLKCPTCTDYKTNFNYWTKDDIESDIEKQDTIKFFNEMMEQRKERDERIERRNGKYDYEIAIKSFKGKRRLFKIKLECDDITKSYFKGLQIKLVFGKKEADYYGYTITKSIIIPLSWSSLYINYIFRHLGKCPAEYRSKFYIGRAIEKRKDKKK